MKKAVLIAGRVLLIIAIICTLLFAFYQSALPPAESNQVSSGVCDAIEPIIPSNTPVGKKVHSNIREIAHFTEFFFLGFFTGMYCILVSTSKIGLSKIKVIFILASLGFGTACACIDETIQFFSARTPDILDVLVDSAGYLFSVVLIYAVYFLVFLVLNLILRPRNKHRN